MVKELVQDPKAKKWQHFYRNQDFLVQGFCFFHHPSLFSTKASAFGIGTLDDFQNAKGASDVSSYFN